MFALSTGADHVYFRSDVTASELNGKEWRNLSIGVSITDSMSSLSSESSHQEPEGSKGTTVGIFGDLILSTIQAWGIEFFM